ncbi:MAG: type II secretion system F family protein [Deltaproteobacteria bacterium]|nr:type II secretion system F family protein [Deltaproteobacteria bacterium]
MPIYKYTAIDQNGSKIRDTTSAPDEAAAANRLKSRGYTVLDISEGTGADMGGEKTPGDILTALSRVRTKDTILFFRMFSSLIESNVTISEAMEILHEQTENRKFKSILRDVKLKIENGIPLSDALAAHPTVFPETVTNMIRAGELGGILDTVLVRISDYLESKAALKGKMILSMIYPSVVVVVATGVIIFLVAFVIPKFSSLLGGRKLPPNTQFLLDVADFLTTSAIAIIITVAGFIAAVITLMVIPETRFYIDRYKIHIPVMGPVFRYGVIVQFAKTFSALLESGITLVEALEAVSGTISNLAVKKLIAEMNQRVLSGDTLSSALTGERFFTPMVGAMVKIGEHSGLLDKAMVTVGELHEKILEDKIARMSAMIEPALIVVLGGLVGYVAWGLIAGMLAMYTG